METGRYLELLFHDGESERPFGKLSYEAFIHRLLDLGAPGFTVKRARSGLDRHNHIQRMQSDYLYDHLPVVIEIFVTCAYADRLLHEMAAMPRLRCTVFVQSALDLKSRREDEPLPLPTDTDGAVLKVYMNEDDRADGVPLPMRMLEALRTQRPLWADVEHAVEAYGQARRVHRAGWFTKEPESLVLEAVFHREGLQDTAKVLAPLVQRASGPAILIPGQVIHFGESSTAADRNQRGRAR